MKRYPLDYSDRILSDLHIDLRGQVVDYQRRSPDSNIFRGVSETEEGGHLETSCERVVGLKYKGIRSQDRTKFKWTSSVLAEPWYCCKWLVDAGDCVTPDEAAPRENVSSQIFGGILQNLTLTTKGYSTRQGCRQLNIQDKITPLLFILRNPS